VVLDVLVQAEFVEAQLKAGHWEEREWSLGLPLGEWKGRTGGQGRRRRQMRRRRQGVAGNEGEVLGLVLQAIQRIEVVGHQVESLVALGNQVGVALEGIRA